MPRPVAAPGSVRLPTLPPSQASLDDLFAAARRVRIVEGGVSYDRALGEETLLWVGPDDLATVRALLRIREPSRSLHCMCPGDMAIELHGEEEPLATLGFHHAVSIRYHGWSSDAELIDGPALLRWLDDQGVHGPLEDYQGVLSAHRALERARRIWIEAAPPCLEPFLASLEADEMGQPLRPHAPAYDHAHARIEAAYTSPEERAFALLAWFSHGAGPWSGFPAYESAAEVLLDRLGTSVVLRALSRDPKNEVVLEGAARYLASCARGSARKSELSPVPDTLWAHLTEIVSRSGIADNIAQLEHAAQVARAQRDRDLGRAPIRSPSGIVTVGISDLGPVHGLASDGRYLYTCDDVNVVRFDRASMAPVVLWKCPDRFVELCAGPAGVYLAQLNQGAVARIPAAGGPALLLAERQSRPMMPVAAGFSVFWINNAMVTDPERGAPHVVQRASVMAVPAAGYEPSELVARKVSASELRADATHLYWAEPRDDGRIVLCRMLQAGGAPEEVAKLRDCPVEPWAGFPCLAVRGADVLWVDPDAKRVMRWPKKGGAVSAVHRPTLPPHKLVADERDIYVLVGDPDSRQWHIERVAMGDGPPVRVATYQRQFPDRTALSLDAAGVYWTTDDRILMLPR
jgi:hypothetical protein